MNRRLEENNFEGIYEKIIGPSTYIYVENFKKISLFSNFFIKIQKVSLIKFTNLRLSIHVTNFFYY